MGAPREQLQLTVVRRHVLTYPIVCWLGRKDSNLRIRDPKSRALPLGHAPSHRCSARRHLAPAVQLSTVADDRRTGQESGRAPGEPRLEGREPAELCRPERPAQDGSPPRTAGRPTRGNGIRPVPIQRKHRRPAPGHARVRRTGRAQAIDHHADVRMPRDDWWLSSLCSPLSWPRQPRGRQTVGPRPARSNHAYADAVATPKLGVATTIQ